MDIKKILILIGLVFASDSYASSQPQPPSEEAKKAANFISDGDMHKNGDPIENYQNAIAVLSKQGQIPPNEMLLLARAFVALGTATRATNFVASKDYFNRAMVILDQITHQINSNMLAQTDAYILAESVQLRQQAKNGLPPIS